MATRFVKAKVDKYIQLYSEYAKHSGSLFARALIHRKCCIKTRECHALVLLVLFTGPTLSLSVPPAGGVRATATCTIVNGVPNTVIITNPGFGYITAPNILVTGGGGGTGVSPTITTTLNLDQKR